MKTHFGICLTAALVLISVEFVQGAPGVASQQNPVQAINVPAPTPYAVTSRNANSRVWEQTVYEQSPSGQVVPKKHHYTELATGLNYQQNGQWVDSKEEIDIQPNGTASATQGQHQAYFPGDIYNGEIELVTPDGVQLHSRPMGLSYFDGTNSVLIAELTNSIGQVLDTNKVIYADAFTDFKADLVYTYRKGGFEQDIILREQPPTPESFGLNSQNTRLQVLTEFFDTADPVQTASTVNEQDGLSDTTLTFGQMKMIQGKAFTIGGSTQASPQSRIIPVYKSWQILDGRTFLVEELPVQKIETQLEQLPVPASAYTTVSSANSLLHKVSATRLLPPTRLVQASTNTVQMARAESKDKSGIVLDYIEIDSDQTNFTFQGDTTYYVSGSYNLIGTTTFEGGTVIKMDNCGTLIIGDGGTIVCQTSAYRPGVFTSMNDDSVGWGIDGSSGSPSTGSSTYISSPNGGVTLQYLRMSYAGTAISAYGYFYNCQFVQCGTAIYAQYGFPGHYALYCYNDLFASCGTGIQLSVEGPGIYGEHLTVDGGSFPVGTSSYNPTLVRNSIFTGVTSFGTLGDVTFDHCVNNASSSGIYQTVGGGSYYLANGSTNHNAGTTNINFLTEIQTKTTYPPIVYSNVVITTNMILTPQIPRDTNAAPDLGYHYDPLDYVFGGCDLFANFTITAGTALGWYQDFGSEYWSWQSSGQPYGISLNDGANFTATGTATRPCWIVHADVAQEGNGSWEAPGWMGGIMVNGDGSGVLPQLNAQFAKWATIGVFGEIRDNWDYGGGSFANCEFYGSNIQSYRPSYYFTNCLFFRFAMLFYDSSDAATFTIQNCTFYGGGLAMDRSSGQSSSFWTIKNTAFDGTAFTVSDNFNGDTNYTAFDYNAYNISNLNWQAYEYFGPLYGTLEVAGPHDVDVTNFDWQSSWLGNFYLPSGSPLIDMGSITADQVGLYCFTTQTSQVLETNSIVDIGYHYMAVDANGNPVDSDGDGVPNWMDANPNDPTVGILTIFIDSPANGAVLQ